VHGLHKLETFKMECSNGEKITILGIKAIAHAVIDGCPQLRKIYLSDYQDEDYILMIDEMIEGMLHVAGRDRDVVVPKDYWEKQAMWSGEAIKRKGRGNRGKHNPKTKERTTKKNDKRNKRNK